MTVGPIHRSAGLVPRPRRTPSRLTWWSTAMALAAVVVIAIGYVVVGIAQALDAATSVTEGWVGAFGSVALYAALVCALFAFTAAVVALVQHHASRRLWLPLAVLPMLVLLGILAEGVLAG